MARPLGFPPSFRERFEAHCRNQNPKLDANNVLLFISPEEFRKSSKYQKHLKIDLDSIAAVFERSCREGPRSVCVIPNLNPHLGFQSICPNSEGHESVSRLITFFPCLGRPTLNSGFLLAFTSFLGISEPQSFLDSVEEAFWLS